MLISGETAHYELTQLNLYYLQIPQYYHWRCKHSSMIKPVHEKMYEMFFLNSVVSNHVYTRPDLSVSTQVDIIF